MPTRYPSSDEIRWAILHCMAPAYCYAARIPRPALVELVAEKCRFRLTSERVRERFDRKMRREIEALRVTDERGARICIDQEEGAGYWYGNDEEVLQQIAREKHRAATIFENCRQRESLIGRSEQETLQPELI